jgi:hypothetical protein
MSLRVNDRTQPSADHVALQLAETLERLVALVNRELNAEANEGVPIDDPFWAPVIQRVVDYSAECVAVLDEPAVLATLTVAASSR